MRRLCATYAPLVPDCLGSSLGLARRVGTMTVTMNGANIYLLKAWSAEVL